MMKLKPSDETVVAGRTVCMGECAVLKSELLDKIELSSAMMSK